MALTINHQTNDISSSSGTVTIAGAAVGGGADLYSANESSPAAQPSATGANGIAIGDTALASGVRGMSLGFSSTASGEDSSALGRATASGDASAAVGFYAEAQGAGSVAMGYSAIASASFAGAFGRDGRAAGENSITMGRSYASGADSFAAAIGNNTASYGATGANSIAIGLTNKATSTKSLAIGGSSNSSTGNHSSTIGGTASTASGFGSYAIGTSCIADADYSYAIGSGGKTNGILHKHAVGLNNGQQGADYLLGHTTADATPVALNTQVWTPTAANQIILQDYTAFIFSGTVVAREKGSTGTDVGAWEIKGVIRRESGVGTTVLVNSVINEINAPTGWAIAITADTTFGCLKVEATGVAATSIKWLATIKTAEVTYA